MELLQDMELPGTTTLEESTAIMLASTDKDRVKDRLSSYLMYRLGCHKGTVLVCFLHFYFSRQGEAKGDVSVVLLRHLKSKHSLL